MNKTVAAVNDWGIATWTAFTAGMTTLLSWVPKLLGALLIVLIGWAVASLAYNVTARVLRALHFDQLVARMGITGALERAHITYSPSEGAATLAKWVVLLVTVSVAADAVGLTALSAGIASVIGYVPNVIAAAVIVGLGLMVANFVRDLVAGATASAGLATAGVLGEVVYWSIAVFAILGAIGQLNIAPTLMQTLYTGIVAAAALAAGLAFGLGLRDQARDVVAGRTMAETLRPGDDIIVGQVNGTILEVGLMKTTIDTHDGEYVTIPNSALVENKVQISATSPARQRLNVSFGPTAPSTAESIQDTEFPR